MTSIHTRKSRAHPLSHLPSLLHWTLAAGFMLNTFIGTNPLGAASLSARAEGNPLDRLMILGLAGLSIVVLLLNWRELRSLLLRGSGIWIIAIIALLSVVWSQHPDLTLRRSILFLCSALIAAGIAAGVKDLSKLHRAFSYFMSAIVVINLIVIVALPHIGIEELGARGIYSQKNVAGLVAMIAMLVIGTLMADQRAGTPAWYFSLAMLFLTFVFLVLTKSKTSLGLAVAVLTIFVFLMLVEKGGPVFVLGSLFVALLAGGAVIAGVAAFDFDIARITTALFGDASFTGRDDLWAFVYRSATDHFLLGYGYGAFWDVGVGADPLLRFEPGAWLGDIAPGIINQAHNGYLDLWVQLGLPTMLFAVATVLFAILAGALASFLMPKSHRDRTAMIAMVALLVVYLLHNLTETSLFARGLIFCNVTLPILFLFSRLPDILIDRNDINGPIDRDYD
jgi:exopolysaccharide production protein ExoQ